MAMPSGRVKFFNTDRGYGFIAPDDGGSDVFVYVHDVEAAGMKILGAGQLSPDQSRRGTSVVRDRTVLDVREVRKNMAKRARLKWRTRGSLTCFAVARAAYRAACRRWPEAKITLRQGARVVERNWSTSEAAN